MKRFIPLFAFLVAIALMFSACNINVAFGNANGGDTSTTTVPESATTPEITTPEITTPEETTSTMETTPEQITPEVTTPEASTPEETSLEVTTPEAVLPEVTTIEGAHIEIITSKVTAPEVTTPEAIVPAETTPEESELEPVELDPDCDHLFTKRIVLEQVTTKEDGKVANVCGKCGGWQEEVLKAVKSLKILAIGNSFSNNALTYLPIIAKELGIEEIVIGKLYRGSCTVERHWTDAQKGADYESFQVNTTFDANWTTYPSGQRSLIYALKLCDWDIITFQQASGTSGVASSLSNLQNLIDFVDANKTNPNAKFYWHMTWAYSQFSTHGSFPTYNKDQMTMYNAIIDVTKNNIATNASFAGIIPAGTAVQNYRDNQINDSTIESKYITTDGYHLQTYSQLLVTLTWLRTLTGLSLDAVTCTSHTNVKFVKDYQLAYLKKAAEAAYLNPYEVTYVYSG